MIVIPGKIPIFIHPFFWVLAALIGFLYGGFSLYGLLWIVIVFISVLFHEMGHAITARWFKQTPKISLVALGGLTSYEGKDLNFYQQFLIVLNGPIFGLLLFLGSFFILSANLFQNSYIIYFFTVMKVVNFFWSVANLVPVLPLDGGQLLRIVFEGIFGTKGFRIAVFLSMIFAIAIALTALVFYQYFIVVAIIFFLFAFQNFELFAKSRYITSSDRDSGNRKEILEGERALFDGNTQEAKKHFEKIREKEKDGVLHAVATQYLAMIYYQEKKRKEAYDLLLSIKEQLSGEGNLILHELSSEYENYSLVAELSQKSYQLSPTGEVALLNARAFAFLNNPKAAGGWLQTALELGKIDLDKILSEGVFKDMLKDPTFKEFLPKDVDEK